MSNKSKFCDQNGNEIAPGKKERQKPLLKLREALLALADQLVGRKIGQLLVGATHVIAHSSDGLLRVLAVSYTHLSCHGMARLLAKPGANRVQ